MANFDIFKITKEQWSPGSSGKEGGVQVDERSALRTLTIGSTNAFEITHRAKNIRVYAWLQSLPEKVTIGEPTKIGNGKTKDWKLIGSLQDAEVLDPSVDLTNPAVRKDLGRIIELKESTAQKEIDEREALIKKIKRKEWEGTVTAEIKAGYFAGVDIAAAAAAAAAAAGGSAPPKSGDIGSAAPTQVGADVKIPIQLKFDYDPIQEPPTTCEIDMGPNQNLTFKISD